MFPLRASDALWQSNPGGETKKGNRRKHMKYPCSHLRRSGHVLALLALWCSMGSTDAFGAYEPESRHVSVLVHAGHPVGVDDVRNARASPATCRGKIRPGPVRTNSALQHGNAEQINSGPARTHETLQRRSVAERISPGPARMNETGEELYRKACATCHGANGRGVPAALLSFVYSAPRFHRLQLRHPRTRRGLACSGPSGRTRAGIRPGDAGLWRCADPG